MKSMYSSICLTIGVVVLMNEIVALPFDSDTNSEQVFIDQTQTQSKPPDDKDLETTYDEIKYIEEEQENTQGILNKIQIINDELKNKQSKIKPNANGDSHTSGTYVIDHDTLEKIKLIIAEGKLNSYSETKKEQNTNSITNEEISMQEKSRALPMGLSSANMISPEPTPSLGYITQMPVMVFPPMSNSLYSPYLNNDINYPEKYQTRQNSPTLPFNIQWPLAPFFPVLIKDPLLNIMGGGSWNNFVEYGQTADVCGRKQKSINDANNDSRNHEQLFDEQNQTGNFRKGKLISKQDINSPPLTITKKTKYSKHIFAKPASTTVSKPQKLRPTIEEQVYENKDVEYGNEGDLKFHFDIFGNKKPIAPSPGFFINRLKVRKGGVAIAGPGGVATAGRGGTAVVGPGGLAYTQPGGLAVAGPAARVIALSRDSDLNSIVSRLQQQSLIDSSVPRLLESIPEGKVVATGPIIYYHPKE